MSTILSYVIISLKNMSVIKLLKLQDKDMSSPYDKKILFNVNITLIEIAVIFSV